MLRLRYSSRRVQKGVKENSFVLPKSLKIRVGFLLGRSGTLIREAFDRAIEPLGIQCRHFAILSLLHDKEGLTQQNIVNYLLIDRTTMVTLIDQLETASLVERKISDRDGRAHLINLTLKGRKIYKKGTAIAVKAERAFFAPLSSDEWFKLQKILEKLVLSHMKNRGASTESLQ